MVIESLDQACVVGARIRDSAPNKPPNTVYNEGYVWIQAVAAWLEDSYPNTGLVGQWHTIGTSNLLSVIDFPEIFVDIFQKMMNRRLEWLGNHLPVRISILNIGTPHRVQQAAQEHGNQQIEVQVQKRAYVNPDRIAEIKDLQSTKFDFQKLVQTCEELNIAFASECYLAVAMLSRSIVDHIPPVFGQTNFANVVAHHGTKSFKDTMKILNDGMRKIADGHLHSHIRSKESLPNETQVDFSQAMDVLLAEVCRVVKTP